MALVECMKCNAKISNKADSCPKCACDEPFKKIISSICHECNAEIKLKEKICPNCGHPEPFSGNKFEKESTNNIDYKQISIKYSWDILDEYCRSGKMEFTYPCPKMFIGMASEDFKEKNPYLGLLNDDDGNMNSGNYRGKEIFEAPTFEGIHSMFAYFENDRIVRIEHEIKHISTFNNNFNFDFRKKKNDIFDSYSKKKINVVPNGFTINKREFILLNKLTRADKVCLDMPAINLYHKLVRLEIIAQNKYLLCNITVRFNYPEKAMSLYSVLWDFTKTKNSCGLT